MNDRKTAFSRTQALFGKDAMERLFAARVAVFGIGGVGGYVAEALARSGIGALDLFDNDVVSETDLNRQIIALFSTLGRYKTEVMQKRIGEICPETAVTEQRVFFLPENADDYDFSVYTYVVDAVDTVAAKLAIIEKATAAGVPVISAMGTGNKWDPSKLQLTDLSKTNTCPLARVVRKELGLRGIKHLPVVWSTEPAHPLVEPTEQKNSRSPAPGSTAFVPSAAGLMIASKVVRDIIRI